MSPKLARVFTRSRSFASKLPLLKIAFLALFAGVIAVMPVCAQDEKPAPEPAPRPPIHIVPFVEPGSAPEATAPTASAPHVVYFGGPVISNIHVIEVLYGSGAYLSNISSPNQPSMASFFNDITTSSWMDMLQEYSTAGILAFDGNPGTNQTIGHGFFDSPIKTITPSPANSGTTLTDQQIQSELLAQVIAGNLPPPMIDATGNETIYMIFFPPGTTIVLGNSRSCAKGGFCAYHNSTTGKFSSHSLYYGVFPDMQSPSLCSTGCGGNDPFSTVTNVASHELAEAVTDADVGNANVLGRPLAWVDPNTQFEIGDVCVGQQTTVIANGSPYNVQLVFSNLQNSCAAAPPTFQGSTPDGVIPGQLFDLSVAANNVPFGVITGYTGTVHFTSTDPKASLPADYTYTAADAGSHIFVISMGTPGTQTITFTDTHFPFFTGSQKITVSATQATRLTVAQPGTSIQNAAEQVTISARDIHNNIVTNYGGTIHFSSSDPSAVLPADTALVHGIGNFPVTYKTLGGQTLTATDAVNSIIGVASTGVIASPANPTSTALVASPNNPTFPQGVSFTATVTQGGSAVSAGVVTFSTEGQSFGSVGVNASGQAQMVLNPSGGPHTIFADYQGDASHPPSSSSPSAITVAPAATSIFVTNTPSPSTLGTQVLFSGMLSALGTQVNEGFVTFKDGGIPFAVISPEVSTASLGYTSLSIGSHTITADYSGTANFKPSSASPVVQVVNAVPIPDYNVQSDKNSATIMAGQSATFVITANSLNGFNGSVKFACNNLPLLTTCTFTQSTLNIGGGISSATTTLTVKTSGPHALLVTPQTRPRTNPPLYAKLWTLGAMSFGIVLIGFGQRRKRPLLLVLTAMLLLCALVSCGGGGTPPPPPPPPATTPAGTTAFAVTATGAANPGNQPPANPSQTLSINITVQQ